jgi:uncharacterized membrane protein
MKAQVMVKDDPALVACAAALATLIPVTLFQTGVLSSLPDPPGNVFASEQITSSKEAHPLGIPDGILGLGSYAATFTLILLARRSPAARKLLGAKLMLDGSMAAFNVVRQVVSFGKVCSWCTCTAVATAALVWSGREVIADTLQSGEATYKAAHDAVAGDKAL